MPSKMRRKATARRPGVPGAFSGPSNGAIRIHKSSGICHIVGVAVLALIASLLCTKGSLTHQDRTVRFSYRLLGETPIKGLEAPLPIYEVLDAGPLRTKLQVAARRGLTRFVGRHSELD